jgi:broad specificity phosphatase PhoE
VSSLYLVRHGQAGTMLRYDTLSETGRWQAKLLGEYFAERRIPFDGAISGGLARQRQTAEEVARVYAAAGRPFPEIATDPHWDEFDLDAVYRDVAPVLSEADPRFRKAWAEIRRLAADDNAPVHRRWSWCDVEVIRAWIEGRVPCRAESWDQFRDRVAGAVERLAAFGPAETVAVFTSAVPIGIWAARSLGIHDHRAMRQAGVLHNASFSTMRLRDGDAMLQSLNQVPHLPADLHTLR